MSPIDLLILLFRPFWRWISNAPDWLWQNTIPQILATVVGALIAIGTTAYFDRKRRKHERRILAAALVVKCRDTVNAINNIKLTFHKAFSRAQGVPDEHLWRFVQPALGMRFEVRPVTYEEFALLVPVKKVALYADITRLQNTLRILIDTIDHYSSLRKATSDEALPYMTFDHATDEISVWLEYDPNEAKRLHLLCRQCGHVIRLIKDDLEKADKLAKDVMGDLNAVFTEHRKYFGMKATVFMRPSSSAGTRS